MAKEIVAKYHKSSKIFFDVCIANKRKEIQKWIVETTGRKSCPIVFVKGEFIGGYSELSFMVRSGELDKLLNETKGHKSKNKL